MQNVWSLSPPSLLTPRKKAQCSPMATKRFASLQFSSDAKRLVAIGEHWAFFRGVKRLGGDSVHVFDTSERRLVSSFSPADFETGALTPDGTRLIISAGSKLEVLDVLSGSPLLTIS